MFRNGPIRPFTAVSARPAPDRRDRDPAGAAVPAAVLGVVAAAAVEDEKGFLLFKIEKFFL